MSQEKTPPIEPGPAVPPTNATAEPPPPPQTEPPTPPPPARAAVAMGGNGLQLSSLDDLLRFSRVIVESGIAPEWAYAGVSDRDTPAIAMQKAQAAVAIAVQAGLELGGGPLSGLQWLYIINNHIAWYGKAAVARVQNSGLCKPGSLRFWTEGEKEATKGVCVAWRVGYNEPDRREFTMPMALKADLFGGRKDNWKKYPERMFAWRAVAWLLGEVFPDALGNFPLAEDVIDYDKRTLRRSEAQPFRAALPAPTAPDPLFAELGLTNLKPDPAPTKDGVAEPAHVEAGLPSAAEAPPFQSHAEADKAIAEEEAGPLFRSKKR